MASRPSTPVFPSIDDLAATLRSPDPFPAFETALGALPTVESRTDLPAGVRQELMNNPVFAANFERQKQAVRKLLQEQFEECSQDKSPSLEDAKRFNFRVTVYRDYLNGLINAGAQGVRDISVYRSRTRLPGPEYEAGIMAGRMGEFTRGWSAHFDNPGVPVDFRHAVSDLNSEIDPPFWNAWLKNVYDKDKGGFQLAGAAGFGLGALAFFNWTPIESPWLRGAVAIVGGVGAAWAANKLKDYFLPPGSANPLLASTRGADGKQPGREPVVAKGPDTSKELPKDVKDQAKDAVRDAHEGAPRVQAPPPPERPSPVLG
ncbi:MAG: hypothetical protein JO089_08490 [Alphaproteobacteria bacterium]|nr:hypothetical protein [Alphaproteobacteria bacterium]